AGGSSGSAAGGSAGTGLGGSASGGLPAAGSAGTTAVSGSSGSGGSGGMIPPGTALLERMRMSDVTVPEGVKEGVDNWRIWGTDSLHVAPVYVSPLGSCETLVCFTTDSGGAVTARVARLDANDVLVGAVLDIGPGLECRGVAGGPDGQFAALLWDDAADKIFVRSFDLSGAPGFDTELVNADNTPDDFGIGESRFEYGAGRYGAYYHVHSTSGHEGDSLKWVDATSGMEDTEWAWGCSHSMSNALRYHPTLDQFTSSCVTDCYPGTGDGDFEVVSIGGLYMDGGDSKVIDMDAGCNGSMAGELGTLALAPNGFKVVFNGHQAPATLGQNSYDESTMNQDIGFSSIAGDLTPSQVVWLTSTPELDEADSSIVPFAPMGEAAETYLVGWSEPGDTMVYKLGRIDAAGAFVEGPIDATAAAQWGRRDDPFRSHKNGDAIWAWFDDPGSSTLHVARVLSGNACTP
ncbi:MAG TPA: hypothetical protein VM686_30805, partial [Polyangiaceae bacterium]|nr:hypothetical protein [Polyangiaceae bacterium]